MNKEYIDYQITLCKLQIDIFALQSEFNLALYNLVFNTYKNKVDAYSKIFMQHNAQSNPPAVAGRVD